MTTGQRIKTARKNAGLTQKELGEKLGVTYQTLAQWENDLRKPKLETLQRIAFALGVRIDDLLGGYETFDSGSEFDKRWKELAEKTNGESITVIHTVNPRNVIDLALDQLTEEGQLKAAERVIELTEIPRYRKDIQHEKTPKD